MDEFLHQDKLLLIIGLFQFGLIFFMFMITNLNRHNVTSSNSNSDNTSSENSGENISGDNTTPRIESEALTQANIRNPSTPTPNPIITEVPESANLEIAPIVPEPTFSSSSRDRQLDDLHDSAQVSLEQPSPEDHANHTNGESQSPMETVYSVNIDPELFTELMEISNNPAVTVDEAIRWWLRRRNLESLDTSIDLDRRYRVGMRSSSKGALRDLWND